MSTKIGARASIGPRIFLRGKLVDLVAHADQGMGASIGPRIFLRGKPPCQFRNNSRDLHYPLRAVHF